MFISFYVLWNLFFFRDNISKKNYLIQLWLDFIFENYLFYKIYANHLLIIKSIHYLKIHWCKIKVQLIKINQALSLVYLKFLLRALDRIQLQWLKINNNNNLLLIFRVHFKILKDKNNCQKTKQTLFLSINNKNQVSLNKSKKIKMLPKNKSHHKQEVS